MDVALQSIQIIADDFNRDGKTDLAVLNQQTKTVSMLLGNGDGTLDLAFVFFPGKLAGVFPGLDDGTFSTSVVQLKVPGTSTGNFAIAAAPFDNGDPDRPHLAIANGIVAVMLSQTDFPDPGFHVTVTDPTGATIWTSGIPQTVTFDYSGFTGNFKIDLSTDGGMP